jgi:hypothetical protein
LRDLFRLFPGSIHFRTMSIWHTFTSHFFIPVFFRHLDNRLPPFYTYWKIRNILSAERHDNYIIILIEKGNIMHLVTFNPKQAIGHL